MALGSADRGRLLAAVRALAPELATLMPHLDAMPLDRLRALHSAIAAGAALYLAGEARRTGEPAGLPPKAYPA
jgi:hypothetical protein